MPSSTGLFLPVHLNQFHDRKGHEWPGQFNSCNCWATVGANAVRFATRGKKRPTPPEFRIASGNQNCPGNLSHIETGCKKYGVSVDVHWGIPWDKAIQKVSNGQFMALQTDYDVIGDKLSCQSNFDGNHMIYVVQPGKVQDVKKWRKCGDPLCKNRKFYPEDVIRRAGEKDARALGYPEGYVLAGFVSQ